MRKGIICALAAAFMTFALAGCGGKAEEAVPPADAAAAAEEAAANNDTGATQDPAFVPTDAEKLKSMAVGETAVWKNYEVTVDSVDRADGKLVANITVKSHNAALSLDTDRLLSFGMPPVESSFADGVIQVPAGEAVSGSLTFDDQYSSQRLFWNDGAIEATWLLDAAPAEEPKKEEPKKDEKKSDGDDAQAKAVKNIEKQLPDLFANNTYYSYQGVDSASAKVTAQDGGYLYENSVSILDGNGEPATVTIRTTWDSTGKDCTSMELDGTVLF